MTAKRFYMLLITGITLVLLAMAGIAYSLSKTFTQQANDLAASKGKVEQLTMQQESLKKSKQDIRKYADLEKITSTIVPQDKDQAQTVREIINIAAQNRISLNTISFPSSSLGTATSSPSAAAAAKPNLSQLTPVKSIPGVYNLQITIANNPNSTVTFSQLDGFLRDLENNRRTAAVSSISIQPQASNANRLTFTLVINTYIKPSS